MLQRSKDLPVQDSQKNQGQETFKMIESESADYESFGIFTCARSPYPGLVKDDVCSVAAKSRRPNQDFFPTQA